MGKVIKGLSGMLKFDPSINHIKKVTTRINTKTEVMDIEKLKAYLDSPEGKAETEKYFSKLAEKQKLKEARYRRFEKWLETNDFDKLMYRLILEHGEEWREKCWHKGYEVYSNNKLSFVTSYVFDNLAPISVPKLENMFPTEIRFFKGYYFRIMHGQGSVFDLYNGDDFKHLLSA